MFDPSWNSQMHRIAQAEISPELVPVNNLLKQRADLEDLCGEILGTLRLPSNKSQVEKLGPEFQAILDRWQERFKECIGDGEPVCPTCLEPITEPTQGCLNCDDGETR